MPVLRLLLADQLSHSVPTLQDTGPEDVVLMAEVREEATYVKHHKKKIAFLFSAMRHFAGELRGRGYEIIYSKFDDKENTGILSGEVQRYLDGGDFTELIITEPGEYRLLDEVRNWQKRYGLKVEILEDTRFIASHEEFREWAKGRNKLVMEYWYREMRKKTGLLMEGDTPVGGSWNYDKENRKPLKGEHEFIRPAHFRPDAITLEVLGLVEREFDDHFGDLEPFWFGVTAKQAEEALEQFIERKLYAFGDYQDAMKSGEAFLYHSVLSQYINCGLLDPLSVCKRVEESYLNGNAPLNAAEGFIRQIIGWREFVRGVYWLYMPEYAELNQFNAKRPLPAYYWDGDTKMNCVSQVVSMTRQHASSHHIQRLMVTGNFANLAGLDVKEVCDWYLAVYADAYEWVELTNTLGMALYADGGILASKPYISSGAYINRMSNFCKDCQYDHRRRTGEKACPFTTLYWDYLMRHRKELSKNQRMALAYRNLDRISAGEKEEIRKQARQFLKNNN